jgi:DNA-binding NarL/FixJ family response regulator
MHSVPTRLLETPVLRAVETGHPVQSQRTPFGLWPEFLVGQLSQPVRVLIVSGDARIRRVITEELMGDPRTVVVGEADSPREARKLVRSCEFDVLLADFNPTDDSGYDLITYSKSIRSAAEIVVISVLHSEEDAMRAFKLGAAGFLVKDSWFGNYVQAVLQVANGGAAITPTLARRLLLRIDRDNPGSGGSDHRPKTPVRLSEREKQILRLIANGLTSPGIGTRLAIATMTVNTHVRNIYRKLHVRTRAQAVTRASDWGYL